MSKWQQQEQDNHLRVVDADGVLPFRVPLSTALHTLISRGRTPRLGTIEERDKTPGTVLGGKRGKTRTQPRRARRGREKERRPRPPQPSCRISFMAVDGCYSEGNGTEQQQEHPKRPPPFRPCPQQEPNRPSPFHTTTIIATILSKTTTTDDIMHG